MISHDRKAGVTGRRPPSYPAVAQMWSRPRGGHLPPQVPLRKGGNGGCLSPPQVPLNKGGARGLFFPVPLLSDDAAGLYRRRKEREMMLDAGHKRSHTTLGKRLAANRFMKNECPAFIFLRAAHWQRNRSDRGMKTEVSIHRLRRFTQIMQGNIAESRREVFVVRKGNEAMSLFRTIPTIRKTLPFASSESVTICEICGRYSAVHSADRGAR